MATAYDPTSASEQPVPLPSTPREELALHGLSLQPPLTRLGRGPGLVVFLPPRIAMNAKEGSEKPLDPDPVQKWAEEGFGVVGVNLTARTDVTEALAVALAALDSCEAVDVEGKYAVLVYDPQALEAVTAAMPAQPTVVGLISHGAVPSSANVPTIVHAHTATAGKARRDSFYLKPAPNGATVYQYKATSPYFVVPAAGAGAYSPLDAGVAHTRSLVFLREQLGGPYFDLEAIWEEHTYFEFEERSVAKTMGTMVAEPYVNHVPTITGGVGREKLFEFYRDHFIFNNPESTTLTPVSRTVGADRVVDEFIFSCTHDRQIDWLLPGVPPTNRELEIPMIAVVNIRGDRLYHEHIWWDQATALQQAGLLPDTVPLPGGNGSVRLPVSGDESARMLLDERAVASNFMLGPEWGVHK